MPACGVLVKAALDCSKSAWDIQPSLPDGMLWYRRRTQPDWMSIWPRVPAETWVRHELHSCCNLFYPRCSFPACSMRHGRCMEGGDTESDFLFIYKILINFSHLFTSVSRCSSAFSSKPGWLDQIALLPHSCNLGYTVRDCYRPIVMGSMMVPEEWSRISQCSTLYKYTIYHRDLTILLKTILLIIVTCVAHTWDYQAFIIIIIILTQAHLTYNSTVPTTFPLLPFSNWFLPNTISVALITVFRDFRHPFPNFSSHQLFSRFPAFFSIGRGCRWDPPLQTGSLRIRCSLPQVSLSKLTFSPLRASPSLPPHPVPVWMVENIPTLPRR